MAPESARVSPLWSLNLWKFKRSWEEWCRFNEDRRSALLTWWWLECLTNNWQIYRVYLRWVPSSNRFFSTRIHFGGNPSEFVRIIFNWCVFSSKLEHQLLGWCLLSLYPWTIGISEWIHGFKCVFFFFGSMVRTCLFNSEIIAIVIVIVKVYSLICCSNCFKKDLLGKLQWLYDKQEFSRWHSSWWYNSCSMTPFDLASETATLKMLHSTGPFMGMQETSPKS